MTLISISRKYKLLLTKLQNEYPRGELTYFTKRKLEEFIYEIKSGTLETMFLDLMNTVSNPSQASLTVNENILNLYAKKNENDCASIINLGQNIVQILRESKQILDFYYQTQLGEPAPQEWIENIYNVYR